MTSQGVDAPPHAMFRCLVRWGRFVFESHAAPSKALDGAAAPSGGGGAAATEESSAAAHHPHSTESHSGIEYRVVWFRAIDGVAIGHTKWCPLTVLHNVVSVVDFQNSAAIIDIAAGYMANTATRVVLLQLQQRNVDPTTEATQYAAAGVASRPVVAATGAVDIGMFVGAPPRSYIVTLEASFFAVGKLHINLVVKEPRVDDDDVGSRRFVDRVIRQRERARRLAQNLPVNDKNAGDDALDGGVGGGSSSNVEKLVVLCVDSMEPLKEDGGKVRSVGIYGIARLLQDHGTEDKRFPLPLGSSYQVKVSFVLDSRYVARPQLVRSSTVADTGKQGASSKSRAPARDTTVLASHLGHSIADFDAQRDDPYSQQHQQQHPTFRGAATTNLGDLIEDDDETHATSELGGGGRKVTTFRTNPRTPHDGRITWRCGIALQPCTKIKFALYRDQARVASTAIMASQLAVASLPHDFALPIRVPLQSGNQVHIYNLQINLTLAEHVLDTVGGEVYAAAMAEGANGGGAGGAARAGHVIMVPGSDLMVMLRGYDTVDFRRAGGYQAPFSRDEDPHHHHASNGGDRNPSEENPMLLSDLAADNNLSFGSRLQQKSPTGTRSGSGSTANEPFVDVGAANNNGRRKRGDSFGGAAVQQTTSLGDPSAAAMVSSRGRFAETSPMIIPADLRGTLHEGAFVTRAPDSDVLIQAENQRLAEENAQLRAALQEQEERIRDQEGYILTLLEQQGVVGIEGEDDYGSPQPIRDE